MLNVCPEEKDTYEAQESTSDKLQDGIAHRQHQSDDVCEPLAQGSARHHSSGGSTAQNTIVLTEESEIGAEDYSYQHTLRPSQRVVSNHRKYISL